MGAPGLVLIVSDDPVLRDLLRDLLVRERIRTIDAATPEEALTILREEHPCLLLVDGIVGGREMTELLSRIPYADASRSPPPVLLLAGSSPPPDLLDHDLVVEAICAPFAAPALVQAVRHHLAAGSASSHTRLRAPAVTAPKTSSRDES